MQFVNFTAQKSRFLFSMNLKEIIISQKERDYLLAQSYIQTEGLSTATDLLKNDFIKVIFGLRKAGKSVFVLQMLKETNFAYLNFDDERLLKVKDYR